MGGDPLADQQGEMDLFNPDNPENFPSARAGAATWADDQGHFWVFGGQGADYIGNTGELNDLWQFDPAEGTWTPLSGIRVASQRGEYGTLGEPGPDNTPGSRNSAVSWMDGQGNLWLFGGWGYAAEGFGGYLNDLWMFDVELGQWAWMGGSNQNDQFGRYGDQGIGDEENIPGARAYSVGWPTDEGLFLFGGEGFADTDAPYPQYFSDLWYFDMQEQVWKWLDGPSSPDEPGIYGDQGAPSSNNHPGAREKATGWTDAQGNLWLFGGNGFAGGSSSGFGLLNDLWRYNPGDDSWAWMAGGDILYQPGEYGFPNRGGPETAPGAREHASAMKDDEGRMWLFGGWGIDSEGETGYLNDFWYFDPQTGHWTWVGGVNTEGRGGEYGAMQDIGESLPGGRLNAASLGKAEGLLWILGGRGIDAEGDIGALNDVWAFDIGNLTGPVATTGQLVNYLLGAEQQSDGTEYDLNEDDVIDSGDVVESLELE